MLKRQVLYMMAGIMGLMLTACGGNGNQSESSIETQEMQIEEGMENVDNGMPQALEQGDKFPDFTVELSDGSMFTLSEELKRKDIILINVWASWCGPCKAELPFMDEAYQAYKDKVGVVCVSASDRNDAIEAFKKELGISLPMAYDTAGLSDLLVDQGIPVNVVIDRFGNYAFYECGSLPETGAFTRLFDHFLDETYTETVFLDEIPRELPDLEAMDDVSLSRAFCQDGTVSFSSEKEDPYAWPFVLSDGCLINANTGHLSSYAIMDAQIAADTDDVFTFDYEIDSDTLYDGLYIIVNGQIDRFITGKESGSYVKCFDQSGNQTIELRYVNDGSLGESKDLVKLSHARLLKGKEAEDYLLSHKKLPKSLTGRQLSIKPVGDHVEEIEFEDPSGMIEKSFGSAKIYLVTEDVARFYVEIGDEVDEYSAFAYGDGDSVLHLLSQCEMDQGGYYFDTALASVEGGSYSSTYVYALADRNMSSMDAIVVFKNEDNISYFLNNEVYDEAGNAVEGISWHKKDDTKASYTIRVEDTEGNLIDGCMLNICTDESCSPVQAAGGLYSFDGEPYAYEVHVLKAPDEYMVDTDQVYVLKKTGDQLTITLEKK